MGQWQESKPQWVQPLREAQSSDSAAREDSNATRRSMSGLVQADGVVEKMQDLAIAAQHRAQEVSVCIQTQHST